MPLSARSTRPTEQGSIRAYDGVSLIVKQEKQGGTIGPSLERAVQQQMAGQAACCFPDFCSACSAALPASSAIWSNSDV